MSSMAAHGLVLVLVLSCRHCEAYLPLLGGWVRADPDRLLHLVRGLQKATQRIEVWLPAVTYPH
jgi:hypothetical protein